jgi:hypothetical protein
MSESIDIYRAAVTNLASVLVEVWQACENGYDHHRGLGVVGNLPEALSYALGRAAVLLGFDSDTNGTLIEGDLARQIAADMLVCHRPGSWEADHVRQLVYPPDLIEHPHRP